MGMVRLIALCICFARILLYSVVVSRLLLSLFVFPLAGHQMVNTAGLWKKVGIMLSVHARTCLSMQPMLSLQSLHPTTKPSLPQDLSVSQVQHTLPLSSHLFTLLVEFPYVHPHLYKWIQINHLIKYH